MPYFIDRTLEINDCTNSELKSLFVMYYTPKRYIIKGKAIIDYYMKQLLYEIKQLNEGV